MTRTFLEKMTSARAAMSPDVAEAMNQLRPLAGRPSALAGSVAAMLDILPALFAESVRETPPSLTSGRALAKLERGTPLLRDEVVEIDVKGFRHRWLCVCRAVEHRQESASAARLADALCRRRLQPAEMIGHVLAGQVDEVRGCAERLGLDGGLCATVLRLTLFPVLSHLAEELASLRGEFRWNFGHCPVCGSWPLLGEFRGLDQTRLLRCGVCAAEWEFPRLACPFCMTRDHNQLGFFHVEGEEARLRTATCDACRRCVKMVSTLERLTGPELLAADAASLHLDLAATDRGYTAAP